MGKKVATPKNTFQTPKRNTGNDDDDVVAAKKLVDMEARLAKRLDDEKAARDDEKATRDAQMGQLEGVPNPTTTGADRLLQTRVPGTLLGATPTVWV